MTSARLKPKGAGIKTTTDDLRMGGYPLPEYLNDMKRDTFTLILKHPIDQVTPQVEMMDRIALILNSHCYIFNGSIVN